MTLTAPAQLAQYEADIVDMPVLGSACMLTVHKVRRRHDEFAALLASVDLAAHTPTPRSEPDWFRKVSGPDAIGAKKQPIPGVHDRYCNTMVRNVVNSTVEIVRHVVLEEVDQRGRKLTHTPTHALTFDYTTKSARTRRLDGYHGLDPALQSYGDQIARGVIASYAASLGCVDEDMIRSTINSVLAANQAVQLKAGVNFIAASPARDRAIAAIKELARDIDAVSFYALPLVNTSEQREMVAKEGTRDVTAEIDSTLAELQELLGREGKLPKRTVALKVADIRAISEKADVVENVIEDNLTGLRSRIAMLERMTQEAMRRT
jgi:hypothetical protein